MDQKGSFSYWKQLKLKEIEQLLIACSGLWLEAYAADYIAIPGQEINITSQIICRNNVAVKINGLSFLEQTDTVTAFITKANELYTFKHKEKLSATAAYSNPYWLNQAHEIGLYTVHDPLLVGVPENKSKTNVLFDVTLHDLNLRIQRSVVYKYTDPVKGEVYRPLEVLPPATIAISDKVFVFTNDQPKTIQITIKANRADVSGQLNLMAENGWSIKINQPNFKLVNKGDEIVIDAQVTKQANANAGQLKAQVTVDGISYNKSINRIEYDHIPYQFILSDAKANLVNIDIKKPEQTIAYIPGAGDDVIACLKQIGYNIVILSDELLASEDLTKYKTIVTGIRAYNTNERLQVYYTKLMDYVKNGGNLVVQYNTNSRVGPVVAKIGPYPFTVSRERVTNENAEVRFKSDSLYVLNYPNKITSADFQGWVQERGIYFATELDKNYQTVFSMNDPNEKAQDGSLIIAQYGKGNFVYTGLAFFRELPAGVPGAYRLFVNLLSLPPDQ